MTYADQVETKTCTACGRDLPLDDDHWYWVTRPSGERATNSGSCRRCQLAAQKERALTPEQKARKAAAEVARKAAIRAAVGEDEARARKAAEMAEYRARKRAPELLPAVRLAAEMLAEGESVEAVALALARTGVRPPTQRFPR